MKSMYPLTFSSIAFVYGGRLVHHCSFNTGGTSRLSALTGTPNWFYVNLDSECLFLRWNNWNNSSLVFLFCPHCQPTYVILLKCYTAFSGSWVLGQNRNFRKIKAYVLSNFFLYSEILICVWCNLYFLCLFPA